MSIIIPFVFSAISTNVHAEEFFDSTPTTTIEKVTTYGFKRGDIGLGFNAVPILDLTLNALKIQTDTGARAADLHSWPSGYSNVLVGKYYLSKKMAARAKIAFNIDPSTSTSFYDDPVEDANTEVLDEDVTEISDTTKSGNTQILLSGGVEFRRGTKRLQGFYGGEVLLGYGGSSSSTEYGWSYDTDAEAFSVISDGTERTLSSTSGASLTLGLRGFAGIEYYISSQITISAEYGYAIGYSSQGRGGSTSEIWKVTDGVGDSSVDTSSSGGAAGVLRLGADNGINSEFSSGTGAIMMTFHI